MLNLLYVITRAQRGGAQMHVLELLKAMRHRARITLACGEEGFLTEAARSVGVTTSILKHLVHPIHPLHDIAAIREMRAIIHDCAPNLIHCHSSKAGLVGRVAAAIENVPSIFTAHGWEFAPGLPAVRRWTVWPCELAAGRLSAHTITVSGADRRLALASGVARADQITVIPNGLPDEPSQLRIDFGERSRAADVGPEIITVCRLASPKTPLLLLRTLALIDLPWRMKIVGDGPLEGAVRQLADKLGIASRVTMLGARDDVPRLLAGADIFALSSDKEGSPLTIVEAMRASLPVVASDVGGVGEQIVDGQTGLLCPVNDVAGLACRLQALIQNPALRHDMGQLGRARYVAHFTASRMIEQTWNVYRQVTDCAGAKKVTGTFALSRRTLNPRVPVTFSAPRIPIRAAA